MPFKRILCVLICCTMLFVGVTVSGETKGIEVTDEDYFTFLWTTDPQWYSFAYKDIIAQQNEWVAENYKRLDIRYVFHTGDFVDLPHNVQQWEYMSEQYRLWDRKKIPYGILPGNHDVDGDDRTEFSSYFGKARYENNSWYGGDYKDNYGHYDLMTCDGVDFVFLYLGYGEHTEEDYAWLNSVLKRYEKRIAILNFHAYLEADGKRSSAGENLFEQVVLKNPNVRMVLCGHNYNAVRRADDIDDDGDGVSDRTVYQMMANYQNLTNGGNGYMRFMECDINGGRIICRTYSPYLDNYCAYPNSEAEKDEHGYRDEFIIPFDFSAPHGKESKDPETGTVLTNAKAIFAMENGNTLTLPLKYFNTFEVGAVYNNAGLYDRHVTMDARDAFSNPSSLRYLILRYVEGKGYVADDFRENGDSVVTIPQRGAVIALAEDARDSEGNLISTDSIPMGSVVSFRNLFGMDAPAQETLISMHVPFLGETFGIVDTNRAVNADEWVLYDSLSGKTSTSSIGGGNKWEMVFAFSPVEGHADQYVLTACDTQSGSLKNLKIPDGGFALAVNSYTSQSSRRAAMRKLFVEGLQVILMGYKPGEGYVFPGESVLPQDETSWYSSALSVEPSEDGNATVITGEQKNAESAWFTLEEPISFHAGRTRIYFHWNNKRGTEMDIRLYFHESTPEQPRSCVVSLYSLFPEDGAFDAKGEQMGYFELDDSILPRECFEEDGTVKLNAIAIELKGKGTLTLFDLHLYELPEDEPPLTPEEDEDTSASEDTSAEASVPPSIDQASQQAPVSSQEGTDHSGVVFLSVVLVLVIGTAGVVLFLRMRPTKP